MIKPAKRTLFEKNSFPIKLFYKIGEASRITKLEPYVLRYWETEFPFLKPKKGNSGQRLYQKKDIEIILEIKRLLYNEKFTIEGVRRKLTKSYLRVSKEPPVQETLNSNRKSLEMVKSRLRDILRTLNQGGA